MEKRPIGRFAPTPSGRMHLGNVFAALMSWLSPKSQGGDWILRMEDLDTLRTKAEYAELLRDDLRWLGLNWDEETEPLLSCLWGVLAAKSGLMHPALPWSRG